MQITLKILNKDNIVLMENSADGLVGLVYQGEYAEGDKILLETEDKPAHIVWQVDDALGSAMCYVKDSVTYDIPFGEKKFVYSPKTFSGNMHYLYAREATKEEVESYRNLALNVADQHKEVACYPHASANVETRGEAVFEAKNAIDGVFENHSHGRWPYASWGINRDPNAELRIDFSRKVKTDCLKLTLRADFPHDAWWTQATVTFSDGSREILHLVKTDMPQAFPIAEREIEWLTLGELIKAEDESPFPALTQIEVYGRESL